MGVKNINKLLATLSICIIMMLAVSGAFAEGIDDDSSDVAKDPAAVKQVSEPTFTLVYAVIGLIFVGILFYTGYMK